MKKKFISFREFGNIYGQSRLNNLYVMRCHNRIPDYAFRVDGKVSFIDINFFIRRKKFQSKVWLSAHDNYYFLTRHLNCSELARLIFKIDQIYTLNSWTNFLNDDLFRACDDNLLNYKTEGMILQFLRISRWIIRGLFIVAKVKLKDRDISILLDRY